MSHEFNLEPPLLKNKERDYIKDLADWDKFAQVAKRKRKGRDISINDISLDKPILADEIQTVILPKRKGRKMDKTTLEEFKQRSISYIAKLNRKLQENKEELIKIANDLNEECAQLYIDKLKEICQIPDEDIKLSEQNATKIEIKLDGKWKRYSATDFCMKVLTLDFKDTVNLLSGIRENTLDSNMNNNLISLCVTKNESKDEAMSTPVKPIFYNVSGWNLKTATSQWWRENIHRYTGISSAVFFKRKKEQREY